MNRITKELIPYIIIVIVVVLIRMYLVTPVIVSGNSMIPTLEDRQLLLLNKINYKTHDIERYDIVVIKMSKKEVIKRVIGLPGEMVEQRNNVLYINGHEIENDYDFETDDFSLKDICNCDTIPADKYLVLGDNRKVSADSRIMGLIDKADIEGNVNFSLWPLKKIK